jgi:hypothetical protein
VDCEACLLDAVATLPALWLHEASRVFCDPLTAADERCNVQRTLHGLAATRLGLRESYDAAFDTQWPLMFADFAATGVPLLQRRYVRCIGADLDAVQATQQLGGRGERWVWLRQSCRDCK